MTDHLPNLFVPGRRLGLIESLRSERGLRPPHKPYHLITVVDPARHRETAIYFVADKTRRKVKR